MPERWLVELTGPARRGLDRLPEKAAAAVLEFLNGALSHRPTTVGKPLRLDRVGEFTARRGTWRIIHELDHERHTIRVLAVGHRANVLSAQVSPTGRTGVLVAPAGFDPTFVIHPLQARLT